MAIGSVQAGIRWLRLGLIAAALLKSTAEHRTLRAERITVTIVTIVTIVTQNYYV